MKPLALTTAAAVAVTLCWVTLTAAAGDRIETSIRRTVSCTTALGAVQLQAYANNPTIGAANLSISTGNPNPPTGLLGLSNQQDRYGLSGNCHASTRRIVLTHRGLTSAGASRSGDVRWSAVYCPAPRRVLLRFVITLDASKKPVSATVDIRTQPKAGGRKRKSKAIGFVQWTPKQSVTYYSSACTVQDQ